MKREWLVAALLAAMFTASLINLHHLDRLVGSIEDTLQESREAAGAENFEAAQHSADEAFSLWLKAEPYTHIFLRHPEIDSISDAFFELKEKLAGQETQEVYASFDLLLYHLSCIQRMEHPYLGSIL